MNFDTTNFDRYFVGADKMIQTLAKAQEAAAKAIPGGYPPYNISKTGDNKYLLEMAVAGFGKNNIEIEVANNTLTIKGGLTVDDMAEETVNPIQYLYKGISDRAFTRKFNLVDTVEVKSAEMVNGLLKLWLENIVPENKKPKKVKID
jgi:molecular chaperone IbpA